jgi:hypothetical protein
MRRLADGAVATDERGFTPTELLPNLRHPSTVSEFLRRHHYLGATARGWAWTDEFGVIVLHKPSSRRLPQDGTWLELGRWCIYPRRPNAGSQQWATLARYLRRSWPRVTTVVSYSDPSQGHTGALYRACNWTWAPTWHRLRPPPSGNGAWKDGTPQSVKDRWIYAVRKDERRGTILNAELRRCGLVEAMR